MLSEQIGHTMLPPSFSPSRRENSEFKETELADGDNLPLPTTDEIAGERLLLADAALPRTLPPAGRAPAVFMMFKGSFPRCRASSGSPSAACRVDGSIAQGEGGYTAR